MRSWPKPFDRPVRVPPCQRARWTVAMESICIASWTSAYLRQDYSVRRGQHWPRNSSGRPQHNEPRTWPQRNWSQRRSSPVSQRRGERSRVELLVVHPIPTNSPVSQRRVERSLIEPPVVRLTLKKMRLSCLTWTRGNLLTITDAAAVWARTALLLSALLS